MKPHSLSLTRMASIAAAAFGIGLAGGCTSSKDKDLTVAQLTAVVAAQQDSLKPCYQAALDKRPDTQEFRMHATLHIRKDGNVKSVELDRGVLPGVGPCVEKVVRSWRFPAAQADTYASLPLIFRPVVEPMQEGPKFPF